MRVKRRDTVLGRQQLPDDDDDDDDAAAAAADDDDDVELNVLGCRLTY